MVVTRIFIATYKYDWNFAKICIASIRYWYPEIAIIIIKDRTAGNFNTRNVERKWNVSVWDLGENSYGWGYSKLLPIFRDEPGSYLLLDADTVIVGPVLSLVKDLMEDFIVDLEVQPKSRFKEIYYDLDRIHEIEPDFVYPGYSFNSGQIFATHGILKKSDFESTLSWGSPPKSKFPDIIPDGDQSQLNYHFHRLERMGAIQVAKMPLMLYPLMPQPPQIELQHIINKDSTYPFIIHWAGIKFKKFGDLPYFNILRFYQEVYYCRTNWFQMKLDALRVFYLFFEKKFMHLNKRFLKN